MHVTTSNALTLFKASSPQSPYDFLVSKKKQQRIT